MMTPLLRTSRAFIEEFRKFAVDKLREIVQEQPEPAGGAGRRVRAGEVGVGVGDQGDRVGSLRRKETVEIQEL